MISRRRFARAAFGARVGLVVADRPARAALLGTRAASKTVAVVFNGQQPWEPYLEVGVDMILQALNSGVDAILTPDWYGGETAALKKVKSKGKTVVLVNADAFPGQMAKLGF